LRTPQRFLYFFSKTIEVHMLSATTKISPAYNVV
jgi:hypothetical protein